MKNEKQKVFSMHWDSPNTGHLALPPAAGSGQSWASRTWGVWQNTMKKATHNAGSSSSSRRHRRGLLPALNAGHPGLKMFGRQKDLCFLFILYFTFHIFTFHILHSAFHILHFGISFEATSDDKTNEQQNCIKIFYSLLVAYLKAHEKGKGRREKAKENAQARKKEKTTRCQVHENKIKTNAFPSK